MPKIFDGAILALSLKASDRPVYVEIRAAAHIFYVKAFRSSVLSELSKLPANVSSGLRLVEQGGKLYLAPTPHFVRKMNAKGFPKAPCLNGANFAEKVRATKGETFVKMPTACGEMRIKVAKGDLIEACGYFAEERTGLRIYTQTSGEMLIRGF